MAQSAASSILDHRPDAVPSGPAKHGPLHEHPQSFAAREGFHHRAIQAFRIQNQFKAERW